MFRRLAAKVTLCALVLLTAAEAMAAAYPERPIKLIIPWFAGGGTDDTGRAVARLLQQQIGVPVEVANISGSQGAAGHRAIAAAARDGYTIGIITTEIGTMHWAGVSDLSAKDYDLIGLFNADPAGVQVRADSPWKNVGDLLNAVRESPGRYKSSGTSSGGIWHIALAGMLKAAGIDPAASPWVPTQGAAPALQEMTAGKVDIVTCSPTEAGALLGSGKVRILAVMDDSRMAAFRAVPTLMEATGIAWTMSAWRGVAGPRGMPQEALDILIPALKKVVESPEFAAFMTPRGFAISYKDPADMAEFLSERDRMMGEAMRTLGLAK